MKTSRDQLKSIVKECLIEILAEGMGSTKQVTESLQANGNLYGRQSLKTAAQPQRQQSAALKEAIKRESGGNRVMESILADTAVRTLPSMLNSGDPRQNAGPAAQTPGAGVPQFNGSPEQVFGEEVASKWADLAFAEPRSRKV